MSEPEIKLVSLSPDVGATGLLDPEEEHALYSDPLLDEEDEDEFGQSFWSNTLPSELTPTDISGATATTVDTSGTTVPVPKPIAEPPVPVVMPPQPDMNTKGIVGLQNMGNTCYANSTIQILRAVPEWNVFCMREDLDTACTNKESINAKLIMGYQDLIHSMWSAHRPAYVRPMGFLNVIKDSVRGTVYENFGRPMQNDSHEYLIYLLDNFHEALNEKAGSKEEVPPVPKDAPMTVQADVGWRTFLSRHTSPVVDMFFGMNRVTVECDTCRNKSYSWATFNVYKIPLEGASLQDWFRAENAPSTIDEYECEPCRLAHDKRQPAKKYGHIWRLPQSLFVALRRFDYNGRKNMTACPPISGLVSFAEHFAPESDHPSKSWQFECRAIADHHGGLHGGHYSAQMAHPVTNQWWWIDDSMSQPLPTGPRFGSANYVLYLRRKMDCVAHEA